MAFDKPLVPADFIVPESYKSELFVFRPLTVDDLEPDYEAVMSSINHLRSQKVFGDKSSWPSKELTKKQDLIDLGWHHKEFQLRHSFAFIAEDPNSHEYLGCLYIFSSKSQGENADCYCWIRESHKQLDEALYNEFKQWLKTDWPFEIVNFPGRE